MNWLGVLFLCLVGLILFRCYCECVFAGVALDMIYGIPHDHLMNIPVIFTSITFILFVIVYGLRKRIRFYEE